MKKSILISGSILCLFILCSLSIQSIIADTPDEYIEQAMESKPSIREKSILKELQNRLIELKSQKNNDCDCESENNIPDIICEILLILIYPYAIFYEFFIVGKVGDQIELLLFLPIILWQNLYYGLGCEDIYQIMNGVK
jgi:hypothetical protein